MHYFGQNWPLCIEKVFWGSYCLVCNIGHFDVRTPQNISLNFLFVAFYGYFAAFVQRIVSFRLGRLKNWLKVQVFSRRPQNDEEISHLIWNLLSKLPINLSNFVVFLKIVKYTLKMSTREKKTLPFVFQSEFIFLLWKKIIANLKQFHAPKRYKKIIIIWDSKTKQVEVWDKWLLRL